MSPCAKQGFSSITERIQYSDRIPCVQEEMDQRRSDISSPSGDQDRGRFNHSDSRNTSKYILHIVRP